MFEVDWSGGELDEMIAVWCRSDFKTEILSVFHHNAESSFDQFKTVFITSILKENVDLTDDKKIMGFIKTLNPIFWEHIWKLE